MMTMCGKIRQNPPLSTETSHHAN